MSGPRRRRCTPRRRHDGFTLLEAIVALVILSTVSLSILSWANNNLISLTRIESQQQVLTLRRSALAYLSTINPFESPSGEATVGNMTINWSSEALGPARDGVDRFGTLGIFEVGLFTVSVSVQRDDGISDRFSVRHVGYRQVRSGLLP